MYKRKFLESWCFKVRTLFVSGLPMDAKPRELYLLFRAYKVINYHKIILWWKLLKFVFCNFSGLRKFIVKSDDEKWQNFFGRLLSDRGIFCFVFCFLFLKNKNLQCWRRFCLRRRDSTKKLDQNLTYSYFYRWQVSLLAAVMPVYVAVDNYFIFGSSSSLSTVLADVFRFLIQFS